jgi:hypothetical protein
VSDKNHALRKLVLCASLIFGALLGMPMRPERVEETLRAMNRIKVQRVIHQENERDKP